MSFRLVPKSVTLNDLERRNGRYIASFHVKLVNLRCRNGGIYASVCCIFSACTMSSQRKFTFAISSPDEFLVFISERELTFTFAIMSSHVRLSVVCLSVCRL